MFTKTITYKDYNDVERTETFLFNLTKAELLEMEMSEKGGLAEKIQRISSEMDGPELIKLFKEVILKAYGVKSPDGKRFIKNDTLREEFQQTEAFSELFMELSQDTDKAAEFINGLVPNMDAIDNKNHPALKK